jgi:hypothetical protein
MSILCRRMRSLRSGVRQARACPLSGMRAGMSPLCR